MTSPRRVVILSPAERFIARASGGERSAIARKLRNIAADPYIYGEVKFALPFPPIILTVFYDGEHAITYSTPDNNTVSIKSIVDARDFRDQLYR